MRLKVVKLRQDVVGADVGTLAHKTRARLSFIASRRVFNKLFRRTRSHNPAMLNFIATDQNGSTPNLKINPSSTNGQMLWCRMKSDECAINPP